MEWNISAECIAGVFVMIIFIYSRKGSYLPTLKNKIFQLCLVTTFCSIVFNIASTCFLQYVHSVPYLLSYSVTAIYFVVTPLMVVLYCTYIMSMIYDNYKAMWLRLCIAYIPYVVYFFIVVANIWTQRIFYIDSVTGYSQGSWIALTYYIFYFYILVSLCTVVLNLKAIERPIRNILMSFPLIATLVIGIQQLFPQHILTGSAAACALLIVYLYFQNKSMSIDFLTGVSNRQEFLRMLDLKITSKKNTSMAVVVVSMNDFKFINDKFGHRHGDSLLKEVCNYFKTLVRVEDLYRYSGDQFAIVFENPKGQELRQVVEQVNARMELPWQMDNSGYIVTCSIALIEYPQSAVDKDSVLNGIDYTLSQAKQDKLTHFCRCTPEMIGKMKRRHQIFEIMKDYMARDAFEVYFQPIYSVDSGKFRMAESLLRMNNTPLGVISPGEFIPIAEETGLIIQITYQVLNKVCRFIKEQLDKGSHIEGVAVNLSVIQFMQDDLAEKILKIIESYNIPMSTIKFEITESVLASNTDKVIDFINFMHERNIRFGLDDFGTGYSNFSSVLSIPFHTIKLDKSLVWRGVEDDKTNIMVRYVTKAFKKLNKFVLAEGVENGAQNDFVVDCGCDMVQGFLYARPMPGPEAQEYFVK